MHGFRHATYLNSLINRKENQLKLTADSLFYQYHVTELPVLLSWSHFKASVNIVELARIEKL